MAPRRRVAHLSPFLVYRLRRSRQHRIQRGLDVDALFRSGRDCGPDAVEVVGVCAVPTDASRKASSRRNSIAGRSKTQRKQMSEPEELRGGEQSKQTKGCADNPAMKGRLP